MKFLQLFELSILEDNRYDFIASKRNPFNVAQEESDRYGGIYSIPRTLEYEVEKCQLHCHPGIYSMIQDQLEYQVRL